MISDPELDQWGELWRSGDVAADAGPAERARKAVWRFRVWIYLEVLVTVAMGGGFTMWAVRAHQTPISVLAIWVWLSLAAAWLFRLISDWNDFTGAAVATGSYLAVLLRRLRSSLRAAEFGGVLFVVQLIVTSLWAFVKLNRQGHISLRDYLALPANVVFAFGTVAFALWLVRYRRRVRREIVELEKMGKELGNDSPATTIAEWPAVRHWRDACELLAAHVVERIVELRKGGRRVW